MLNFLGFPPLPQELLCPRGPCLCALAFLRSTSSSGLNPSSPPPVGCCSFGKSSLSCVFSLFFSTGSFPGTCKCAQPLPFYNNSSLKLTDHPPHLPLKVLSSFLLGSSFPLWLTLHAADQAPSDCQTSRVFFSLN